MKTNTDGYMEFWVRLLVVLVALVPGAGVLLSWVVYDYTDYTFTGDTYRNGVFNVFGSVFLIFFLIFLAITGFIWGNEYTLYISNTGIVLFTVPYVLYLFLIWVPLLLNAVDEAS